MEEERAGRWAVCFLDELPPSLSPRTSSRRQTTLETKHNKLVAEAKYYYY
jgi:hypothetical protein